MSATVLIPVGVACIVLGVGLVLYGAAPAAEPKAWYFNTTATHIHSVQLVKAKKYEWGPFATFEDCSRAQQSVQGMGSANTSVCYEKP